jgi:hypothetical protein
MSRVLQAVDSIHSVGLYCLGEMFIRIPVVRDLPSNYNRFPIWVNFRELNIGTGTVFR